MIKLKIKGMTCASCVTRIERALKKLPGVLDASVNLATEKAKVDFEPGKTGVPVIKAAIRKLGYEPLELAAPSKNESATGESEESHLQRDLLFEQ